MRRSREIRGDVGIIYGGVGARLTPFLTQWEPRSPKEIGPIASSEPCKASGRAAAGEAQRGDASPCKNICKNILRSEVRKSCVEEGSRREQKGPSHCMALG